MEKFSLPEPKPIPPPKEKEEDTEPVSPSLEDEISNVILDLGSVQI